jgi:hypothetical protein
LLLMLLVLPVCLVPLTSLVWFVPALVLLALLVSLMS